MKKLHRFFNFVLACLLSTGLMMTTLTSCTGGGGENQNRQEEGMPEDNMQRDTLQSDTVPNR